MLTKKLDQYYTKPAVAKRLFLVTEKIIKQYEPDLSKFFWIEPSAGAGAFYDCLPPNKRIGIEIDPPEGETRFLKMSFYNYWFVNKPYIVIGNPPFGKQGREAMGFIEKSKEADFIAMILPSCFIKSYNVKVKRLEFNLLYNEVLDDNCFYTVKQKNYQINSCFQIYSKHYKKTSDNQIDYDNLDYWPFKHLFYFILFNGYENEEQKKYFQFSTITNSYPSFFICANFFKNYSKKNKPVYNVKDLFNKGGIYIKFKTTDIKIIKKITKLFEKVDWLGYANITGNQAYRITRGGIIKLLIEHGFKPRLRRDLFNENL